MFASMMPLFAQRGGRVPVGPAGMGGGSGGGGGGDGPEVLLGIVAVVVGLAVAFAVLAFVVGLVGLIVGWLADGFCIVCGGVGDLFGAANGPQRVLMAFGLVFLLLLAAGGVLAGLCAADVVDRGAVRSVLAAGIDRLFT